MMIKQDAVKIPSSFGSVANLPLGAFSGTSVSLLSTGGGANFCCLKALLLSSFGLSSADEHC
jgi:hypothetical protein